VVDDARALLVAWLRRRSPEPVEIVETHISVLGFQGDRVYKAKKAVHFPFVDLSTTALREADCDREVALNRRFAPDVYLGVLPVTDAAGTVVDHVVEMHRLPDERRLAVLAREGHDARDCLDRLAGDLARIHETAPTGGAIDASATAEAVAELWELGIEQVAPYEGNVVPAGQARCVAHLARAYVSGRRALFASRVASGRARDGHGDLLAQDIFCLDDGPRAIDCLEFDDRLRYGDVLADVAFLAMDLEHLGRPDLAAAFLRRYHEASDDDWPSSLEDTYIAYRAHVRAKIACLRHDQGDADAAVEARELLDLAHRHLTSGRVRLVLIGGVPASGKTTLANAVTEAMGWYLLRSDVVRKELVGLRPRTRADAPLDEGIYSRSTGDRTYAELLARARQQLEAGTSVVLDASWADSARREAAKTLAEDTSSALVRIECSAPEPVRRERAAARASRGDDASDVGPELAALLDDRFAAWPEATNVDTDREPGSVARAVVHNLRQHTCHPT
jgi:aminoglycoside phosphotransferase family enzyme/predicted kinase